VIAGNESPGFAGARSTAAGQCGVGVQIEQRHLEARDGTRIGYQATGAIGAPCVVLANGLGGTHLVFRGAYAALTDHRTICWDYRGLATSGVPADPRAITMTHQVNDLLAILAHERVDEFVVVGWSMGVQVALEMLRHHRDRVRGIFAINGTSGRTFQTVLGSRFIGATIPMLLRVLRARSAFANRATRAIVGSRALVAAMTRVGLVSSAVDPAAFRAVAAEFGAIDWHRYSDLLAELDAHDATELVPAIDVPVTVVTGDRDVLIPATTARQLHAAIPGARLVVVPGGTHYTPVEYPQVIADELARWLDRIPGWQRPSQRRAS
jgi:pimeloyl-ACP methyl ester carboxylesterase